MTLAASSALARRLLGADPDQRRRLLGRSSRSLVTVLKRRSDEVLRSDPAEALRRARIARAAGIAARDALARALGDHALAKALHAAQRYTEALAAYQAAGERYGALGRVHEQASVSLARVGALLHLGRFSECEAEARDARRWFLAGNDPLGAAKVLVNLASVRHAQDRHHAALRLLERSRPTFVRAGDALAVATVDLNRANSYSMLARFGRSGRLYHDSRAVFARLGLDQLVARVDYNLAYDLFLRGRLHDARRLLADARVVFRRTGARHMLALAARDEAEMALLVGQAEPARAAALEARAAFLELAAPIDAARSSLLAAEALIRLDQGGAREHLTEARALFSRGGHAAGVASADLALAVALPATPGVRLARARRAAAIFAGAGLRGKEALARVLAGTIEAEAGRTARAYPLLRRARASARRHGLLEAELLAEHALARVAQDHGDDHLALAGYRRAIRTYERLRTGIRGEDDRLAFAASHLTVFEDAMSTALDLGRPAAAFAFLERARARVLAELLGLEPADLRVHPRLLRRFEHLRRIAEPIAAHARRHERRSQPPPAPVVRALRRVATALDRAFTDLALRDPELSYALAGRPVADLDEVRSRLEERALVSYFAEGDRLGALVVSRHEVSTHRGIAGLGQIADAVEVLRFLLTSPWLGASGAPSRRQALREPVDAALAELFRLLVLPLAGAVGDRPLVFVPSATLHRVPFHALIDRGEPLIASREVSLAPSATVLLHALAREPVTRGALVVAVPDRRAPRIGPEARAVASVLGARLIAGAAATKAALRRHAPGTSILHIAAHGVYEPDEPLLGGLDLADGRLSVAEVAALRLDSSLVTLAACETAAGVPRGEEVLGLARAFLIAGTRSLVASLWAAPDDVSAEMMTGFYHRLAAGESIAAALRSSILTARRDHPHPYHWAPYVLIGCWRGPAFGHKPL